ncbi:hypothetical protein ACVMHR_010153 [Bradyrhizobium diazoefficiens]
MESRILQVRAILNRLADQNGGSPAILAKGAFGICREINLWPVQSTGKLRLSPEIRDSHF